MKKLKVLLIYDGRSPMPPEDQFDEAIKSSEWNTEISVYKSLKNKGHDVRTACFFDNINTIITEVYEFGPDIVFNLVEACLGEYSYDKNIPALLELLQIPYTGCGPVSLMICNNKELTKKILAYHKIRVPKFRVYKKGKGIRVPKTLKPPFIVKPLKEEASMGITQNSFADNEKDLADRILFVHENLQKDAIVEEYIDGREIYVSVLGKRNLRVLPFREMKFTNVPDDEPKIATYKAKWDDNYRQRWGIKNEFVGQFPANITRKIKNACKKAYIVLDIDSYVRFDLRLTPKGDIYIIEANANPELAKGEDFASSAEKAGINFDNLIERILKQALYRK